MTHSEMTFGTLKFRSNKPFIIAEAGVNHENDLGLAKKMIIEAANAGADAIKFQSYKASELASKYSPSYWDLEKESTTSQYELFKKHDHFDIEDYIILAETAKQCGIIFLTTPFDKYFVDLLDPYLPVYKIASADITNIPFIEYCARKGKPIILSTGASTIGEVDNAVSVIKNVGDNPIALLHCVLSYPCDYTDANLKFISHLKNAFPDCIIGYSDHIPPASSNYILTTAWLLGAQIIEKHFTLDKTAKGNDHYHAMDPSDLREINEQFNYINVSLGNEVKTVLPCEVIARENARRSLVAARNVRKGEQLQESDIKIKRPGTGIGPSFLNLVIGSIVNVDVQEDQVLEWNMFMNKAINLK